MQKKKIKHAGGLRIWNFQGYWRGISVKTLLTNTFDFYWSLALQVSCITLRLRKEWSSGLRRCDKNQKVLGSNPTIHLIGLKDPTLLWQCSKNLVHTCIVLHMCTEHPFKEHEILSTKIKYTAIKTLVEFKSVKIWNIIQRISLFNLPHVLKIEWVNKFGSIKLLSI